MAIDEDVESSQACPSMSYLFPGNNNYAKDIRSPLANFVPTRTKTSNLVRKLHASDFQSNNNEHLELVKNMGINIISLPDGRVQLLHTLSNVRLHSMAIANLKKSEDFLTNTTAESKYIPRRPRIIIN